MYIIRQHRNRKYYSTETSRCVTLAEMETLFKTVENVNVVDMDGNDITGKVMLAVIANKKENAEDLLALGRILRNGNGLLSSTFVLEEYLGEY